MPVDAGVCGVLPMAHWRAKFQVALMTKYEEVRHFIRNGAAKKISNISANSRVGAILHDFLAQDADR